MDKERDSQKHKFRVIEGNPAVKKFKKIKLQKPPLYIKAAVMGSRKPDIAPIDNEPSDKVSIAINEYRKLVEENSDDLLMINTLGELCVRAGKTDEALSSFIKIAHYYFCEGSFLKSLAVYKKITKLDPSNSFSSAKILELETLLKLR